jgi:hypothetical protein
MKGRANHVHTNYLFTVIAASLSELLSSAGEASSFARIYPARMLCIFIWRVSMKNDIHKRAFFACILAALSVGLWSGGVFAQTLSTGSSSTFEGSIQTRNDVTCPTQHQCAYQAFDKTDDLAFQGNGFAATAVVKDALASTLHGPQFINDGNYGNGSSWIGSSSNSWLKIDLGQDASIELIKFGRDRIFNGLAFDDRDPGNFTIEVAVDDSIYADGDDTNDGSEYTQVFTSAFDGLINGAETLQVSFDPPIEGRFIKMTFAISGAAIDEVEVFGSTAPAFACSGFDAPMANYPVKAKKNRAFPLKMELSDGEGFAVMGGDLVAPPIVQVIFDPAGDDPAVDISDEVVSSGQGSDGNQFVYTDDDIWQFNLKSGNYSAPGLYMVTVISGDETEYTIEPACVTSFEIE